MISLSEMIKDKSSFWNVKGPRHDIVVSSRVRLARNIWGISFSSKLDSSELLILNSLINKFVEKSKFNKRMKFLDLPEMSGQDKRFLRERNLISFEMEDSPLSGTIIDMLNEFTVFVNDEDHLKIQVVKPGLQLFEAWETANEIDNDINKYIKYAFSEKLGYLMALPERNGTGLKLSVILHLPVLTKQKRIAEFLPAIKDSGFNLSGTLGSGERITGGLYILSNAYSQGMSEVDILDRSDGVISNLLRLEDEARDNFFSESKNEFEDEVFRSLGLLKYSRRLSYGESIEHLSRLRLGVVMSIVKDYSINVINDLMVNVQWSHLQFQTGKKFESVLQSDEYRSIFVRDILDKAGELNV